MSGRVWDMSSKFVGCMLLLYEQYACVYLYWCIQSIPPDGGHVQFRREKSRGATKLSALAHYLNGWEYMCFNSFLYTPHSKLYMYV